MFKKKLALIILIFSAVIASLPNNLLHSQEPSNADVAAYQLGVMAETKPGSDIVYSITITNYGIAPVKSFYIIDGWSVNEKGISGFAQPVSDPDFGNFKVVGSWSQSRKDEQVLAWLLDGELQSGATIQFKWSIQVAPEYVGGLVNWARILSNGKPDGAWESRGPNTIDMPAVTNPDDPDSANNRTPDGVTVVTDSPTGKGVDMAIYQTGLLNQLDAGVPLNSTWLVSNVGPETINQFYLLAAWSVGANQSSLLAQPADEPDFDNFKVLGRWRQSRADEELWLWLLEGKLEAGDSVSFNWRRNLIPGYRGDLINWSRVETQNTPDGEWLPREGTSGTPQMLKNEADTNAENDRSIDSLTTVVD